MNTGDTYLQVTVSCGIIQHHVELSEEFTGYDLTQLITKLTHLFSASFTRTVSSESKVCVSQLKQTT